MALLPRKPAKHPAKPKRGKKLEVEEPGVLYGRYSSHNQKDISVEQQFEKGYELAAEYGIRIIDTYADRAVSGRTDKRRDFQRMMTDAAKGKFRYVIAWKSNRMGRNMLEALINEARLQDLGVRVLYVEEDFDDTAAGRFAARSMMNVNQFYSENMAEDIKRGLYDNAANCMVANGHLPYGYKADETLHYAIDEPKAAVIREIFTRVSCGEAFVDIMASLNARGIKTSYGRPWGRSSFQKILSNERYRGIYIYGDVRKEGGIPRIISDELYFKVQEVITTKKNPQGRHRVNGDYLLTGKLFCGHCKSPMTGISGTSRSGNLHYYYVCQKRRTEKTCEKKNLRRDDIELQVAKAIKRRTLDDDTINWIADSVVEYSQHQESASGIGLLEDQLKDTQRSIKNLMAAIEQGIITPTTKARLMELEKEQSDIDRKITMAKADVIPVNRDQLVGWLKKLQAGDVHDKKYQAELFDTFLIAVYVYDNPDGQDYMKVVFNYAGSKNTVEIPLDPSVIDNVENIETGAVRLSSAQVHQKRRDNRWLSLLFWFRRRRRLNPRVIQMLGRSEFALRQDFASQNACTAQKRRFLYQWDISQRRPLPSHEVCEHRRASDRKKSRHNDRQAAHCALDLAKLDGFGRTQRVRGRADADALRNGVGDMKEPAYRHGGHIAENARDDDHGNRQGHIAAELFRNAHADGRGDGLGEQRHIFLVRKVKESAHHKHAAQRGDNTRKNTGKDGLVVLPEEGELFIERHGKADGRGRQKIAEVLCALVIYVIVDARGHKQRDGRGDGDKKRVAERKPALFLQQHAEAVGNKAHRNAEKDGLFEKCHFLPSPFSFLFSTPCVTRPDTAITATVVTTAMTR